jgi:hypothetical protein
MGFGIGFRGKEKTIKFGVVSNMNDIILINNLSRF